MTLFDRTPKLRWIVPVVAGVVLIGGAASITAVTASAGTAALPPRNAAQLLVDLQQAKLGSLSGTIVQNADLGIPSLPGIGGASSSDLTSLISGTHTLRVWYDGSDKARIALLGGLAESDVIKNGSDVWEWSSQANTATHSVVSGSPPAAEPGKGTSALRPTDLASTPQDAADAVLKAVDPSTLVSTDTAQTVAGRAVYQLNLEPRHSGSLVEGSLVERVSIAIDAVKHLPLRVQIFAVGHQDPAFEVAFTSVDFSAPDPAQFVFNPPPGAKVTQASSDATTEMSPVPAAPSPRIKPKVVGIGWTSVLVADNPAESSAQPSDRGAGIGRLTGLLAALPEVSGPWGSGHLLSGTLFSALVTDDGRIAVGAVAPDLLYQALAGP